MKILHVITSLFTGGAEKLMVDLLPRFQMMGHQVHICLFNGTHTPFYEKLSNLGVKIITLSDGGSIYNPLNVFRLIKLINLENYDIVHAHNTACQLFVAIASKFCSVSLCTTEHSTSNRRRGWWWYAPIDMWMYNRYDSIICISDAVQQNLKEFIGVIDRKISVIYNGIDVLKYKNAIAVDRTSITSHPNRIILIMVAGFRYQKDHETVIRAASLLSDNYEIWFVGDGQRRPIIENSIKEFNVVDKVRLLGARADVESLLKTADIVIMSSHIEGFGLAAVEAMAAGKPVVASDVEGLSHVVGGAGVLFPHGDERALVKAIMRIVSDPEFCKIIVSRGEKRASQYNIDIMARKYIQEYERIKR